MFVECPGLVSLVTCPAILHATWLQMHLTFSLHNVMLVAVNSHAQVSILISVTLITCMYVTNAHV